MSHDPIVRAVVVAAGRGTRFGGALPKQFERLGGRFVFEYGLAVLASIPMVSEVVLVVPTEGLPAGFDSGFARFVVPCSCVTGGTRRQDSVAAGLAAFSGRCDVALVHDGARPFPPVDSIVSLIAETIRVGGGLLAVPAIDTIKRAGPGGLVEETLDRADIWLAQTPQAIRGDHLPAVTELLWGDRDFTDETAVMEALGIATALVPGDPNNFKITHAEDLRRAEALLSGGIISTR